MLTEQRKLEIVGIFQASFKRDNSAELRAIGLSELRAADEMLGSNDLNAGFRLRLRNRIKELEDFEAQMSARRARMNDHLIGFAIGVVITLIGVAVAAAL